MDPGSGLYYLQARYYAPSTGQFLSVDPLVDSTQMPYAHVSGDPVNASDSSGLCSWLGCIGAAVNATVFGLSPALSTVALRAVAVGSGFGAAAADGPSCSHGVLASCLGVVVGVGSGLSGLGGPAAQLFGAFLAINGIGIDGTWDLANLLTTLERDAGSAGRVCDACGNDAWRKAT
jgi:hypothetical protein